MTTHTDHVARPVATPLSPADAIVKKYETWAVSAHPFFTELRAHEVDLSAIWLLMANVHIGVSGHFVRWLASTIARVDDFRMASLLAKQLNDELGNGDFQEIHSTLLERFLFGLEPFAGRFADQDLLRPGRRLCDSMAALFAAPDPHEGIGALIVSEIFASKMDCCVGDEIRRQNAISAHALRWLDIHERLEVDHASDSSLLANLVPTQGFHLASTWHGADTEWDALWCFLDDVRATATSARIR
jgi:pyrroloquinoline quinone (PQQ) biosynthesis protein C